MAACGRRLAVVVVPFFCLFLLSGCWTASTVEDINLVVDVSTSVENEGSLSLLW